MYSSFNFKLKEVLVTIDSHKLGTESRREISGRFIMVARDKDNKAIAINKLLLNSEEDKQNFFEAQSEFFKKQLTLFTSITCFFKIIRTC